jgi:hypothetical protein
MGDRGVYFVNWHISIPPGSGNDLKVVYPTLDEAKAGAEDVIRAYTQKDIDIEDADGNVILRAKWNSEPFSDEDLQKGLPVLFNDGNAGWYCGWLDNHHL